MKLKLVLVALAAIGLAGGALGQAIDLPKMDAPTFKLEKPPAPPPKPRSVPITDRAECTCQMQCEAMWSAVPDGLESASRMRVRIASDSFVETYAPMRGQFGVLAGRATRRPDGHGGYDIRGEFSTRYGDADDVQRAEHLFYLIVNEAAIGVQCPIGAST